MSKIGIGATLTKAQAVQTQLDALSDWIAELGENFDENLNRVIPFEYSAKLRAALKLHGIDDPHMAWTVFSARADALSELHARLQVASEYLPPTRAALVDHLQSSF